jgi:transcriptional regulator with XRE-family HTH domain
MIKQLREKSGLTQSQAAQKLKINHGFWCRIESGKVDLPPNRFKSVAKLLGIPLTKLINLRIVKFASQLRDDVDKTIPVRCEIKIN